MVRVDVTALGSAGRSVAQVAGAVVEYLEGGVGDPGLGLIGRTDDGGGAGGAATYYGDSKEGPGRWIGLGAEAHGLVGVVDRDAFSRLLEGRHPVTGARLLTARGSSQRDHLAAGTAARFDENGEALYAVADTARLLDTTRSEVEAMIAAGDVAVVDVDGEQLVSDAEVTRLLDAAPGREVERITAGGAPDDWLSGPQAARLLGVSARYVRRICGRGDVAGVAQLASERVGTNGAFRIRRSDLAEFAANRKPPVARVGFDVTLTTEKSFGVVMMLAGPGEQQRFVDALRTANDTVMAHLDRHAAVGRRRGEVVSSHGLVGATYFHGTSRGLDPHPHHHNVIANAVVDDLGGLRALDARALYLYAPEAESLATAAARWELRDLGLGWWQRDEGMWEISGVDEATIDAFSSRHRDISEVRAVVEAKLDRAVTDSEEHKIWADTRAEKTAVDPVELVEQWRAKAVECGFDVDMCFGRSDAALVFERLDAEHTRRLFDDLLSPVSGVCAESDRFDRRDVVRAVVDWATVDEQGDRRKVLVPPAEVTRLADEFLGQRQVIGLSAALNRGVIRRGDGTVIDGGQPARMFTTAEMVWTQSQIIEEWRAGRDGGCAVVSDSGVEAAVNAASVDLSGEQRNLVMSWCTSGDAVQGAIGQAGTGKTTAMSAAARAWEGAGYRVIGAAVKAEAANQLGVDAGIEADTLALLLTRIRRHEPVLDARTVVIVDEGSTIGDRELLELIQECGRTGATLRIIGDPVQHRSVAAGGCWAYLVGDDGESTPKLAQVHRLRDGGERRRAAMVRAGRPTDVLAEMEAAGQLVLSDSDQQTYAAMLERWYQARGDGAGHPMVHGRNRQRRLLNDVAQQVLIAEGAVDVDRFVELGNAQRLCVGDEVIARHGDRRIYPDGNPTRWMRNGTRGTITAIEAVAGGDVRVTIATEAGPIDVDRATLERRRGGIDLAYAVTSYAVQGSTRDRSTSAVTATSSRAELYVGVTRGRDSNVAFATRTVSEEVNESDQHLPVVERSLVDELNERLARPDGVPVVIADPDVVRVAQVVGESLSKLHAEQRGGRDGAWDQAIERREALIRITATIPERFSMVLPEIPVVPHLRHRYQQLAGDVAVWTESHNAVKTRARLSVLEQAIGPRPTTDKVAGADWDALAERMVGLAVDTTRHSLQRLHPDVVADVEGWLPGWLHTAARNGRLGRVDLDDLAAVVAAVGSWRKRHSIPAAERKPLGPRPTRQADQSEYRRLHQHLGEMAAADRSVERGVA